jgi:IS4 transposase
LIQRFEAINLARRRLPFHHFGTILIQISPVLLSKLRVSRILEFSDNRQNVRRRERARLGQLDNERMRSR